MATRTQPEILRAAGIEHAKIFILAIDDIEDSMNVARHIRLNYPALKLFWYAPVIGIMCTYCGIWASTIFGVKRIYPL